MNFQLRDNLYLPEGASQSMQAFKVKREGSSTKMTPRGVSREASGDLRSSLSPKTSLNARQKSDLERRRSGKQAASQGGDQKPETEAGKSATRTSYSNVKGSGYGIKSTRESSSGSLKGSEIRRSTSRQSLDVKDAADGRTKMKREKSGDILGKSPATRRSTSREESAKAKEASTQSAKPRLSTGASRARTPSDDKTPLSPTRDETKGKTPSAKRDTLKALTRKSTDAQKSPTTTRKSMTPTSKSSSKK